MEAWLIYYRNGAEYNKNYIAFYIDEGKKLGINIRVLLVEELEFGVKDGKWFLSVQNAELPKPDFAICRAIHPLLSKQLELMGIRVFNNSFVAEICNDKAKTYQYLAGTGIKMLDSSFYCNGQLKDVLYQVKPGTVIKAVDGHGGSQVFLIDDVVKKQLNKNHPSINHPGLNQPDINQLGINQPGINQPGINHPGLNQPDINQLGINQPGINQPDINQPGMNQPDINQPGINQPGINQPGINQPDINQPDINQPGINQSDINQPGMNPSGIIQFGINQANTNPSDIYPKNLDQDNDWSFIMNALKGSDAVIQPFTGSRHQDLRVYVIGKDIIASVLRTAKEGFRSNFSLGGEVALYQLSEKENLIINTIIKQFDFGLVGIDFIIGDEGELIFNEIEDVVGSRMLYQCSNINIVESYLRFIVNKIYHS